MFRKLLVFKNKLRIIYLRLKYRKRISIGKKVFARKRFNIQIEKNGKLEIGDNTFFNNDCSINVVEKVIIGENCLFGEAVKIYDHNHKFNDPSVLLNKQDLKTKAITIGNNCRICSNTVILMGVNIGDNCVIGANTVIRRDVNPNTLVYSDSQLVERKIN